MIRGDDELLSVMDEMTSSSSSKVPNNVDSNGDNSGAVFDQENVANTNTNTNTSKLNIRLIPEIEGYGNNMNINNNNNEHHSDSIIWNPYVQVTEYCNDVMSMSQSETKLLSSSSSTTTSTTSTLLQTLLLLPTNPDVEVIRRRIYEKFKMKFHSNFQWIAKDNNHNSYTNTHPNTNNHTNTNTNPMDQSTCIKLWENLPSHNILERFYFASKLEESKLCVSKMKKNIIMSTTTTTTAAAAATTKSEQWQQYRMNAYKYYYLNHNWTVNDIKTLLMKSKSSTYKRNGNDNGGGGSSGIGGNVIMDPILLSSIPSQRQNKGNNNEQRREHNTFFKNNHDLFKNEIMFQLTREMKKSKSSSSSTKSTTTITNNSNSNKDDNVMETLHQYFQTKHFKCKCKKLSKDIRHLSLEMEHEFIIQLTKKATELASSTSSISSTKRKRRGIPKVSIEEQRSHSKFTSANNADDDDHDVKEVMMLTYSGLSFRISILHYNKLQILFDRNNTNSTSLQDHRDNFHKALFTTLCRYDMLEGGGLQSALGGNIFDVLLQRFNCKMECFASPFNCRYERYCSAFPDTDSAFGSMGSFFDFDFGTLESGGCFQANPPFTVDFILAMYERMEEVLSNEEIKAPFMFIVFIPAWTSTASWQALAGSTVLSRSILLSQKEHPHYYCEGTQHRKLKDRYRIASFDTSVFFLQNKHAKDKWPVTDDIVDELKTVFATNPKAQRKSRKMKRKSQGHIDKECTTKQQRIEQNKVEKSIGPMKNAKYMEKKIRKKDNKKKNRKKKEFVDDTSKHFDILSSIGILKGDNNVPK